MGGVPSRLDEFLSAPYVTRAQALTQPSPVPDERGVYGWWFRQIPGRDRVPGIDAARCEKRDGLTLLYVGISPSRPPAGNGRASKQTLRRRIVNNHFRGNAAGSTLRKSLGCLLAPELGLELRRFGSGKRRHFGDGELLLNAWMDTNAVVSFLTADEPWVLEREYIRSLDVPLNIEANGHDPFCPELRAIRRRATQRADDLPILPSPGRRRRTH